MADGIAITAGSGTTVATDDVNSMHHQMVRGTAMLFQKTVTLSADTSAFANGDVVADTQQIDALFRHADATATIRAIQVFDADDQTPYSFTIYLHQTSTSIGTENSGISISDANAAAGIIAAVSFTAGDCFDLINGRMYYRAGLDIPVVAVSGTDDLYISLVIVTGTPTHTAGGIIVKLWVQHD